MLADYQEVRFRADPESLSAETKSADTEASVQSEGGAPLTTPSNEK